MFQRLTLTVLSLLLLGSCSNLFQDKSSTVTPPVGLVGYWKSSYGDGFEISGTSYKQYDDATKSVSFAGTIVSVTNLDSNSGLVTIQTTAAGTWGKTVGKYYSILWSGLASKSVRQECANKVGSAFNSGVDTALQASVEYTLANGYFPVAYLTDYAKQ